MGTVWEATKPVCDDMFGSLLKRAGRTGAGGQRLGWNSLVPVDYGTPEAGLEPATRSLSQPGAPTSDRTTEAKAGAESPPVARPRAEKSAPKPSPKPSPRKRRS